MPVIVVAEDALTCTPSGLANAIPCLQCLSEQELMDVLVFILASAAGYSLPTDTNKVMSDSACFTCLNDKQLMQAAITAIGYEYLERNFTEAEGAAAIKCLRCANPKQLKAAVVYLLCKLFSQDIS